MFYFLIRSENVNFPYPDSAQKLPAPLTTAANCCAIVFEEQPASNEVILFVSIIQAFVVLHDHTLYH